MDEMQDELFRLRQRVERLEAQMVFLFRNLGVAYPEMPQWQPSAAVVELVVAGETKEAIRLVREETGAGLKDAKRIVETLERGGLPEA
jgi:ribosomal protein L7/L12